MSKSQEAKADLTGLFRDNPATPEGKYLVLRRDGTVPGWPSFVLGGADPDAAATLRHYASLKEVRGHNPGWIAAIRRFADLMDKYRAEHGDGDPEKGAHRVDAAWVLELMRQGWSA